MSDLFSMLRVSARALDAQRFGLDVAGQNIANVNTPGYTRRTAVLAEGRPLDPWSPGGGVDVVGVTAARAPVIEARLRYEQPASAREGVIADHLAVLEASLGQPGGSLDAVLARFYNTYGALAQQPTSATARQQVLVEGQALVRSFNDIAGSLQAARRDVDNEARDVIGQVSAVSHQIASINASIVAAGSANSEGLKDQLSVALASLNDLIDTGVIQHEDGTVDVTIGNGHALVVGATAFDVTAGSAPPNGFATILVDVGTGTLDITSEITGGKIGGLLHVRDGMLPGYSAQLDQLAFSVATDVNTLTLSGFDLNGNAGLALFAPPTGVSGAAGALALNGAIAGDPNLVVASATTAAGNNDIARAVAALQDAVITGGTATPTGAWGNLVYSVATDSRTARMAKTSHDEVVQQLNNLREQISGVSIDEEAAMLLRFQRAYEANAKFFQVTSQTLDQLMALVGA